MSGKQRKFRENDLLAYLDGELDHIGREKVEQQIAVDPQAAALVEEWRVQNDRLDALYGHVEREPVPNRLRPASLHGRRRRTADRDMRPLAAALALLAFGGACGWFARDLLSGDSVAAASLETQAMEAHGLYVGEVVHPVEVRADDSAHLQTWLSKRLDRAINIPDLRSLGLTLVGGRLLPSGREPAAQFMYEDPTGRRLTLYVVPTPDSNESAFRYADADGLEAITWKDERVRCAVVGDLPRALLQTIARATHGQLT